MNHPDARADGFGTSESSEWRAFEALDPYHEDVVISSPREVDCGQE
jgi:hypothetical protein